MRSTSGVTDIPPTVATGAPEVSEDVSEESQSVEAAGVTAVAGTMAEVLGVEMAGAGWFT
jgi:hypothetical protein